MTNSAPLYLCPDIQVEPLMDRWYVWSYLVPPHTAARMMCERHMKIMDSYVNAPQVHASAVKNPKLLGGPFIDYGGKRVDEIRDLREDTRRKRACLVALSTAVGELDTMLQTNAKGFSLQPLYERVPELLRGYVELVYDLNNQPSMRFLEPLLYRSPYFQKNAFSLMLSRTKGDDRPFVLSTPRLPSEDAVEIPMAFDDPVVDELFRRKTEPRSWAEILDMVGVSNGSSDQLRSFFTEEPPRTYSKYEGDGVRWRYFGHACILIETKDLSILFDPVLSYTYECGISRYTYADLPERIDYVLVTHNHQDHILFETLLQLRHKIGAIIVPRSGSGALQDPSVKLLLEALGFHNVLEMAELETLPIQNGEIMTLPFLGEHADLDVKAKLAYLVRLGRHKLMFAADSCNIEPRLYEHLAKDVGAVDALFLGMECDGAPLTWLYGPLLTKKVDRGMDESRRLAGSNYAQAAHIVNTLGAKEVYVYAMGQEPWLNHIMSLKYTEQSRPITESNRLIDDCASRGIPAERLFGEKEILLEA
jgi:L-ascorbate metabolism protein UlaG (beta-lactamase superfamily)